MTINNTREYFLNILKKRDFDAYYIHKYKDQKAFCYFNSSLVWQIYVYELSSKRQKPTMISCLLGVHAWLVLTTHEIMFLPHCLKLNMQMMKDDAHNLVPRMHVSEISPPKMILNQRELLGYLYAKVSGWNKRILVKQAEEKHERNTFLNFI